MNSSSPNPAPLTAAEEAEIAEYERIVAFAESVMAGKHPRVRTPEHLCTQAQATVADPSAASSPLVLPPQVTVTAVATVATDRPTRPTPFVNPAHDYYKDLGIHPNTPQTSIERAYKTKRDLFGPESPGAQVKYTSADHNVVRAVKAACFKVNRAYNILSDPELRGEFDVARAAAGVVSVSDKNPILQKQGRSGRGRGHGHGRGRGRGRGRGGRGGRGLVERADTWVDPVLGAAVQ